ncbi:MAG: hypothetical protein WD076_11885, partial [Parvularculaceae bacterium]
VADSRSSYNALLLFIFIVFSAGLAAASRVIASHAHRRSPAWGCGYPPAGPQTQYSATSFAQPIRNTLGRVVFRASETVDMPAPGEMRPATIEVKVEDPSWSRIYAPISGLIDAIASRLNAFQFLTIRQYLSLVFATLVVLLLGLAVWS